MIKMRRSEGGRVVLPAEIRQALGLNESDPVLFQLRDGKAVITTRRAQLARARKLFQQWCPGTRGRSLVDEFIAERRAEAARE
mgnify:CR=1 FL=1